MIKFKGISFFIAIIVYANNAFSENLTCNEETWLYFGNGMNTTYDESVNNLIELDSRMSWYWGENSDRYKNTKLSVSYNPTEGFIEDFLETSYEWNNGFLKGFWLKLAGTSLMPDELKAIFLDLYSKYSVMDFVNSDVAIAHSLTYNGLLAKGNRVIVVPHSQGNFFANIAYENIDDRLKKGFGIAAVATPASYVATDNGLKNYVTIEEDLFMNNVPFALPANVDNYDIGEIYNDWTGHSFIKSYLDEGHPALFAVMDEISTQESDLPYPNSFLIQYTPFIFQYLWNNNIDMDLVITEPDGGIVDATNPRGKHGRMISTSTIGGREEYGLYCKANLEGVYEIGIRRADGYDGYVSDFSRSYIIDDNNNYSVTASGIGGYGVGSQINPSFRLTLTSDGGEGYYVKYERVSRFLPTDTDRLYHYGHFTPQP